MPMTLVLLSDIGMDKPMRMPALEVVREAAGMVTVPLVLHLLDVALLLDDVLLGRARGADDDGGIVGEAWAVRKGHAGVARDGVVAVGVVGDAEACELCAAPAECDDLNDED